MGRCLLNVVTGSEPPSLGFFLRQNTWPVPSCPYCRARLLLEPPALVWFHAHVFRLPGIVHLRGRVFDQAESGARENTPSVHHRVFPVDAVISASLFWCRSCETRGPPSSQWDSLHFRGFDATSLNISSQHRTNKTSKMKQRKRLITVIVCLTHTHSK